MKKRNEWHLGSKKVFIMCTVCAPLIMIFMCLFFHDTAHIIAGIIIPPAVAGYSYYAYRREQKADKQAEKDVPEMISGRKFGSAEWREEYLRFNMSDECYSPIKGGMIKDMKRRFVNKLNVYSVLAGVAFIAASPTVYTEGIFYTIFSIIIGGVLLWFDLPKLLAFPVNKWLKTLGGHQQSVEDSYTSGKCLTFKSSFINLGKWGVVACNGKTVRSFEWHEITSIDRRIVRLKRYSYEMYDGEEYQYYLVITPVRPMTAFEIELGDFRTEKVLEEFQRISGNAAKQEMINRSTYSS